MKRFVVICRYLVGRFSGSPEGVEGSTVHIERPRSKRSHDEDALARSVFTVAIQYEGNQ